MIAMTLEFDSVLEQSLTQIAAGKARVESCLVAYPTMADELRPLLMTAEKLWAIPKPVLAPEAKARIEGLVLAAAGANPRLRLANGPRRLVALPRWRWAFSALTALFLVVFLMMSTLVTASADALPGSALYPVKRAAEGVWLAVTPSRYEAGIHLRLAQRRLAEIQALYEEGVFDSTVLEAMLAQIDEALLHLEGLPAGRALSILGELAELMDQEQETLAMVMDEIPGVPMQYLEAKLRESVALVVRVEAMRLTISPDEPPASPGTEVTPTPAVTLEPAGILEATTTVTPTLTASPSPSPTSTPSVVPSPTASSVPTATQAPESPSQPPAPTATDVPPPAPTDTDEPKVPPGLTKTPEPPRPGWTKTP
jgi:hypothetical protein